MRLDFNVLWVDDQPNRVNAQVERIARQMQGEGFNFNATLCRTADELKARVADDVFTDEIDLVLVDWDLGEQVKGEDVIAAIRDAVPYKDVVFYSARNQTDELRKLAYERGLEGVFCANREGLVDEVLGVFDSLIKKVLDLDHTRGIVMGATSDIDYMVNECLIAIHTKVDDPGKTAILTEIRERIRTRMTDFDKLLKKLENVTDIKEFFKAHMLFTANDRLRILASALESPTFTQHKGYRDAVTTYQKKAVPDRNILGHQVLVPEGKPSGVTDAHGKVMTLEETRELRKLILELRSEFRSLMNALQG